jgi:hypothetical protein
MIPELMGRCAGCDKLWREEELGEIHDFWGRVLAGDIMPLGQCPECEMLCYIGRDEDKIIIEIKDGTVRDVRNVPTGARIEVHDFDVGGVVGLVRRLAEGEAHTICTWP